MAGNQTQPNGIGERENWSSKIGVILAVAGSAVGLGNFLRFPGVTVQNGGGAFMIPYFLAFLLVGIPVCWAEWIMGRRAGRLTGLSSAPGLFGVLTRGGYLRYIGSLGLFIPVVIYTYYVYVESWCLAYAWFSLQGSLNLAGSNLSTPYTTFFHEFTGAEPSQTPVFFSGVSAAYVFFLLTFLMNFYLIYRGLSKGIERFCRIAMPLLVIMAVIIVLRVITLGTPDPSKPDQNVIGGLAYMWNPNWEALVKPGVWIAACGQIFFSLSVGFGIIITYASYLKKEDDVVLSGLTASATNEFCEVCLGGLIVVPAAFIFLGPLHMQEVAGPTATSFSVGFMVMPQIFDAMPIGWFFGICFYTLLFLAGITSSLSMLQPAIAFLEEGFGMKRRQSITLLAIITFVGASYIILSPKLEAMNIVDTYTNSLCIPLLALFEVFIFIFLLKVTSGIKEAGHGADMRLPHFFGFIITYITPVFLFLILGWWLIDEITKFLKPDGISFTPTEQLTFVFMIFFFILLLFLQTVAWPRMKRYSLAYQRNLKPEDLD